MPITTKVRGSTQIQAGTITNTEISATASIAESKLLFNTSTGHDHDGTNSKLIAGSALGSHLIYNEVPSGTINGTNTVFVLANVPVASSGTGASLAVYLNGIHLQLGTGTGNKDAFINANATVTTNFIPESGDLILVDYLK